MQNYKKTSDVPIPIEKIGAKDNRIAMLDEIKREKARTTLYQKANSKYGEKRWEEAWLPYYRISNGVGFLGNLLSAIIGLAGCIYIATSLFGTTVGLIIGVVAALLMEVGKFYFLKYGSENMFAGRLTSGALQMVIGLCIVGMSAYTSYNSATQSPYFRQWVEKETGTVGMSQAAPTVAAIDQEITEQKGILESINKDREQWAVRNSTKDPKWLRADEAEKANQKLAQLEQKRNNESAEVIAEKKDLAMEQTAANLSWWFYVFILLPELLIIVGYVFTEFYEWKVYELGLMEGRTVTDRELFVNNDNFQYRATSAHQSGVITGSVEAARAERARLLAEIEDLEKGAIKDNDPRLDDEVVELQKKVAQLKGDAHPPVPPPSNGKTHTPTAHITTDNDTTQPTIETPPPIRVMGFKPSVATADVTVATVATEYRGQSEENLLDAYRSIMGRMSVWEKRDTINAKAQVVRSQTRINAILLVLAENKKTICKNQVGHYAVISV